MRDLDNSFADFDGKDFNIPQEILDEIQKNIEEIITNFPVPEDNKTDVIKKINFMYSHTRRLSLVDPLTGLYNRRHLDGNLEREFMRAKRYDSDLSLAVIDIDFFKKINDTYGHICGDYVLKEAAYLILESFRKTDIVFRYGGEEFVVLLTETPLESAQIALERLRKSIENYPFKFRNENLKITVSIGAAGVSEDINSGSELLDLADKSLYTAKESGRNRLVIAEK